MRLLSYVTAAAAALVSMTQAAEPRCFPDEFMFGTATAAAQVEGAAKEGGRTPSIWDDFCRVKEGYVCGNVADDFYHRYKSDIALMKEDGHQSFRFSISWSRVMNWDPATRRMKVNPQGLAFYHSLIDELRASNVEPIMTLYHWDLPSELQTQLDPPGWLNAEIQDHYIEFATLIFNEYGHKVDYWTTFNEPLTMIGVGYAMGRHAPGYSGSGTQPYIAGTNLLVSHAKAVKLFRELKAKSVIGPKARVGIVLVSNNYYPLDPSNPKDVAAAQRGIDFEMGWFLEPIVNGDYPASMREIVGERLPKFTEEESKMLKGSYDLFMVNHYSSYAATDCDSPTSNTPCDTLVHGWQADEGIDMSHLMPGSMQGKIDKFGNNYCQQFIGYAPGYLKMIKYVHAHDPTVDILLTENGWCGDGEIENMDQLKYFQDFVGQVHQAITVEKIPVIGYTAWALMDNYEWGSYGPHFGLYAVNFTSQTGSPDFYEPKPTDLARIARPAAKWFKKVATTKCLDDLSELQSTSPSHTIGITAGVIVVIGAIAAAVVVIQRKRRAGYESLPRA